MSKKDLAKEIFKKTNCAQATLVALAGDKIDITTLQLIGSSFGGGIAQQGKTCGAVTGSLMALGIKKGYTEMEAPEVKSEFYLIANQFINEFKLYFGSDQCKDLIHYDMTDPDQKAKAREEGIFNNLCPKFVEGAVMIMEKYIE